MTRLNHLIAAALLCIIAACGSTRFSLPPLGSPGAATLPGKIVWHDLISDTPEQTRTFYRELFGWEFEALPGVNYELIRLHGQPIGGLVDQTRLSVKIDISQWVMLMSVADIELAVTQVRGAGGTVYTPPTSLGDRGRIAVAGDPQGALFALLQGAADPADRDTPPPSGAFLWDELWTADKQAAADFYQGLAPFTVEPLELGDENSPLPYRLLRAEGAPRAGIRPLPDPQLPPMWVNYLRVTDAAELERVLSRVVSLGGEILVPATERPGGGSVAVIAGPSGAGIALQTWPVTERTQGEDE